MARRMCKGQYWNCVIILLACNVVSSLPVFLISTFTSGDLINEVASLASTVLSMILGLGITTFYLAVFRGERGTPEHVTSAFDNGWKVVGVELQIFIRVFIRTLLLIVPGIIEAIRDTQALHVLSDHPEYNSSECIMASQMLMEGNKAKYVKLFLSFIGWALLASLPAAIHAAMFGPVPDPAVLAGLTAEELQPILLEYQQAVLAYQSQIIPSLLSLLSLLVRAYMMMSFAAFFDLSCGNLVVQSEEGIVGETYANYDIEDITDVDRNE